MNLHTLTRRLRKLPLSAFLALLIVLSVFSLQSVPTAYGATITVNNLTDDIAADGTCSIREAVIAANTNSAMNECTAGTIGLDTILLPAGTIAMNTAGPGENNSLTGDLDIFASGGPVEIVGTAPGSPTILNNTANDRILHVFGGTVELRNVSLQNGGTTSIDGGNIYNQAGNLTLRSTIVGNGTALNGGGIYNEFGSVTLIDSTVTQNDANFNGTIGGNGGGIYNVYNTSLGTSQLVVSQSTIDNNTAGNGGAGNGGGIYTQDDGTVQIADSTISNNSVLNGGDGGGIYSLNTSAGASNTYLVSNTQFDGNTAAGDGGGIYIQGLANPQIVNSSFGVGAPNSATGNGGAIFHRSILNGTTSLLTITDTTIQNNTAANGAGIFNTADTGTTTTARIDLNTSTLTGNTASGTGGGIFNTGSGTNNTARIDINTSTLSANVDSVGTSAAINSSGAISTVNITSSTIARLTAGSGHGITSGAGSTITITSSIIHDAAGPNCTVAGGTIVSGNFNIDSDTTSTCFAALQANDQVNVDPLLAALATDAGSPTATHALGATSPAIDTGNCPGATADQRGFPRPVDQPAPNTGDGCDVGAVEFQSTTSAVISGFAWEDVDGDGIQDATEVGLPNVTVQLFDAANLGTPLDSMVTDGGGNYAFTVTNFGIQYIVRFTLLTGYQFTLQNQGADDTIDSDANPSGSGIGETSPPITISGGQVQNFWDAGMFLPGVIGDFVWNDANGNGIQDPGELGVQNVTVRLNWAGPDGLFGNGDDQVFNAATNATGNYTFNNAAPGNYFVEFDLSSLLPTVYVFTSQGIGGDPNLDSDPDPTTGRTPTFTLTATQSRNDLDAGIFQVSSIGDYVWNDVNGDGLQGDPLSEPPMVGVVVNLRGAGPDNIFMTGDDFTATDTTDAAGLYSFTNVPPGQYRVSFVPPGTFIFTLQDQGADDAVDSDPEDDPLAVNPAYGTTATFSVAPAATVDTVDAGLFDPSTISGRVWDDTDGDGIQDGGELGFATITVNLLDSTGATVIRTTTTNATGNYTFDRLPAGDYIVEVVLPTPPPQYTYSQLDNPAGTEATDSDVNQATGRTAVITLAAATTINNLSDAGLHQVATITGFVWQENLSDVLEPDGFQDGPAAAFPEPGVANVVVNLYDATGVTLIATTTTDTGGNYTLNNIPAGSTVLEVVPPAGTGFTLQDQFGDTTDSDVDQFTGRLTVTLAPASTQDFDAGLITALRLGGIVWNDVNANSLRAGETGLSGVTVELLDDTSTPLATTTTNATGNYLFTVTAGDYIVRFTTPTGYAFSAPGGDNDILTVTPPTAVTDVITLAADNTGIDAGMYLRATITGFVWNDISGEGLQDVGEPGVAGITINLYEADGITPVTSTTTAAGPTPPLGEYTLADLEAGTYVLEVISATGFTRQDQGGDDTIDSDINQFSGRLTITLLPGQIREVDAGLGTNARIGDFVWNDADGDGLQGGAEVGVPGINVNLRTAAGALISTTTTNATGNYQFFAPPGNYIIEVILTPSFVFTTPGAGAPGTATDSDITDLTTSPPNGRTIVFAHTGVDQLNIDAGLGPLATIQGIVWDDVDGDSTNDGLPGEPGIPNVTVTLFDSADVQVGTPQTTDANGQYSFVGLGPGTYYVIFNPATLPAGYTFSAQANDSDPNPATGRTPNTVVATGATVNLDAGAFQAAVISGRIWEDSNADGIRNGTEPTDPGIQCVEVRLLDNALNPVVIPGNPALTDATGSYQFSLPDALVPNNFTVEITSLTTSGAAGCPAPVTFTTVSPINQGGNDAIDSDFSVTAPFRTAVLTGVDIGAPALNVDGGLFRNGSIGDFVWDDLNANGIFESPGETGIAIATIVNLYDATGVTLITSTTTAAGTYNFPNLAPGNYVVEVVEPVGYALTLQDQGADDTVDSDFTPATGRVTVTVLSGVANTSVDAGLFQAVTIGNFVWQDLDGDNVQDVGEPGLNGVTVNLYNAADLTTIIQTQTTTGGGLYSFSVSPGSYVVEFVILPGFAFVTPDVGGDDTIDSDASAVSGRTVTINAVVDTDIWDAGMVATSTDPLIISKTAYPLPPATAPLEPGDSVGWVICALNASGAPALNVTLTDNLTAATNQVLVSNSIQSGVGSSCPATVPVLAASFDISGPNLIPDTNNISTNVGTVGPGEYGLLYFETTLQSPVSYNPSTNDTPNSPNAGVMAMSTLFIVLGGWLFRRKTERPSPRLSTKHLRRLSTIALLILLVFLLAPHQGLYANEGGDTPIGLAQQSNGRWVRYEVGASDSIQLVGDWSSDSLATASGGSYMYSDDPDAALTLDFAGDKIRIQYVSLWDSAGMNVYVDRAQVGSFDDTSDTPQVHLSGEILLPTSANTHSLRLQTTGRSNTANANIPVIAVDAIDVWVSNAPDDSGSQQDSSILKGVIWFDSNRNGRFDDADRLLQGVTVFLFTNEGPNDDNLVDTKVTDADGRYVFTNVPRGAYWITVHRETLPDDVDPADMVWEARDIIAPRDTDVIIPSIASAQLQSELTGTAWLDFDGDFAVSDADSTLADVSVEIYGDDGDRIFDPGTNGDFLVDTQVSNSSGELNFEDLLPGIYWVVVDTDNLPSEARQGQTWNLLWVRVPRITHVDLLLIPAPETYDVDGTAYLDIDRDNEVSEDDTVLEGLTIHLYKDNGNNYFETRNGRDEFIGTQITGEDGAYIFDDLQAGVYWVIPDMDNLPETALQNQIWPPLWVRIPAISVTDILLIPAPRSLSVAAYPEGPGALTGHVFNDNNGNRQWDGPPNEPGIADTQVTLYYDNGDGAFNPQADVEVAIAQVGRDGQYRFEGLGNGTFWVHLNEGTLPSRYMDTVGYGGHGDQNPQKFVFSGLPDSTRDESFVEYVGPNFAYALDTDGDGSPDGREGSGDRDNDNVPNYLDPYDPSGTIYAVHPAALDGRALVGATVTLEYDQGGGVYALADTIQPNPQQSGVNGSYRFDINVTNPNGNGLPNNGTSRTFRLSVAPPSRAYVAPSEIYPPGRGPHIPTTGQITPFSNPPRRSDSHVYYTSFIIKRGDPDIVNNHIPLTSLLEIIVMPTADNSACVTFDGYTGPQLCATGSATMQIDAALTLTPDGNQTAQPGATINYDHTLTNTGTDDDRFTITFPAGSQGWTQTLGVYSDAGFTTLITTINPGGMFLTPIVPPTGQLFIRHTITVPVGEPDGTIDTTTFTAASQIAADAGTPVTDSDTDTTTVDAGCVQGALFNDANQNNIRDAGETGFANVTIRVLQGTTVVTTVVTDANGNYTVGLPDGTFTLQIEETTLPSGSVVYFSPTSNSQTVTVTVGGTCVTANWAMTIVDPAITKSASVTQALPGETIVYTINVNNPSAAPLNGVRIVDNLPIGLVFVSATTTQGTFVFTPTGSGLPTESPGSLTFDLGTLNANSQATMTVTVTVHQQVTRPSTLSNTATLQFGSQSETTPAAIVAVPADTTGGGDTGTGTGTGGSDVTDEFGTGGAEDEATGVGEEPDEGPDEMPETGYRPTNWDQIIQSGSSSTTNQATTVKLSWVGRLFFLIVAIMLIAGAIALFRYYNNSEELYAWLENKPQWLSKAFIAVVVLLLIFGASSFLITANDTLGVMDFDNVLGLDGNTFLTNEQVVDNNDANRDGGSDGQSDGSTSDGIVSILGDTPQPGEILPPPGDDIDARRVIIPSLNVHTPLVESAVQGNTWDISTFFDEVAHLEGTAPPGTEGNAVIAGHITHARGYGPFRTLENIQMGEYIIVKDYDVEYTYRVVDMVEVAPNEMEWTRPTDDAVLTLITCGNWNPARRTYLSRIVVRAELERWRIVSDDESTKAFEETLGEHTRYEIGDSEDLTQTGTWEEISSFHTSDGSYYFSEDDDAGVTLRFNGNKFRLHFVLFKNFGMFDIYIDNEKLMTVDAYNPYSGFGTTEVIQISPGRHTMRIVNTGEANEASSGTVIGLDAIDVWE